MFPYVEFFFEDYICSSLMFLSTWYLLRALQFLKDFINSMGDRSNVCSRIFCYFINRGFYSQCLKKPRPMALLFSRWSPQNKNF